MRRTLSFFLAVVMTVLAVPASFLTVIASDNGVIGNDIQNQSIDNSYDQYIPETVTIDGDVEKDTAWSNNKWNEVDTNNGTWDSDSPAEESKVLTYKYQLHYDYEHLYGAIVLGKDIKDAEITVWLNDGSNTSGGYSHKIMYSVSGGSVTDKGMVDYNGTAVGDASIAAQKYKAAYGSKNGVTIEFRRFLAGFTTADAADIEYFVSVKYNNDTLYFPRIKVEGEILLHKPTTQYWPSGAGEISMLRDVDIISPMVIDGKFDEAVWAGLTNFYLDPEDPNIVDEKANDNKGTVSFDSVKTHGVQGLPANVDTYLAVSNTQYADNAEAKQNLLNDFSNVTVLGNTVDGILSVNDGDEDANRATTSEGVRFKYDYRIDGEYFYIALVAEVPKIMWDVVTVAGRLESDNIEMFDIKAEPNINIQFYNKTNNYFDESKNAITTDAHDGWAVEHLITYETYRMMEGQNYRGSFDNVSSRVTETGGEIINVNWWGTNFVNDDTYGQDMSTATTGFQSACSYQGHYGGFGVWHFESRVKLESIMSSQAIAANNGKKPGDEGFDIGDLGFTVSVHDRRWIHETNFGVATIGGKEYKLQYAYLANGKWYYTNAYNRNAAWTGTDEKNLYSLDNLIEISTEECVGNDVTGIVVDGNLDKRNNAALAGADSYIDGTQREPDYPYPDETMQYTYIITADYEYLYGAAVISNYTQNSTFRIWLNSTGHTNYEHVFGFIINESNTQLVKYGSHYSSYGSTDMASDDVSIAYEKINSTDVRIEFRIALSDFGCAPTLTPGENEKLFAYYMTMEDFDTPNDKNRGLIHPRCTTAPGTTWDTLHEGRVFYKDTLNHSTLKTNTVRAYDHNDSMILQYINIDGKLEEEIWNEKSDRITVNGTSGQWVTSPTKNDVFEYSYVIYSGDNYLYGALELDVEAIAKESGSNNFTKVELWLANPGGYDGWGVYENKVMYDNYLFDMYFISESCKAKDFSDLQLPSFTTANGKIYYVYGSSTPALESKYYKVGMTTSNGKTYAEFMIDTAGANSTGTNFTINEALGAEFFVGVTHPTTAGEKLTLLYPPQDHMFYLTHLNVKDKEGIGVIFTDYSVYSTIAQYKWWSHILVKPASDGKNWEIKEIRLTYNHGGASPQLYDEATFNDAINAGGFVYCLNYGNNYIQVWAPVENDFKIWLESKGYDTAYATVQAHEVKNQTEEWQATRATYIESFITQRYGQTVADYRSYEYNSDKRLNFYSTEAERMDLVIKKNWKPGTVISIPGLVPGSDVATQVTTMLANQAAAQNETQIRRYVDENQSIYDGVYYDEEASYIYPDLSNPSIGGDPVIVTDTPYYYESGYDHIFTFDMVTENTDWDNNLPTESKWNEDNYGSLDALEFMAPEKVKVDGVLSDTGWAEDGWVTVNNRINATLQSNASNAFQMKYQIRNDGKYMYVAAVYEGVNYDSTNSPIFWLWINDGDANWTKYYKIGYNNGGKNRALNAEIPAVPDYYSVSENVKYTNLESLEKTSVLYNNEIDVVVNDDPTKAENDSRNISLGYEDSAFYGYTDTVEESVGGRYYPDINIQISEYIFGKECAVMKSGAGTYVNGIGALSDDTTVVEFRVAMDEVDADGDGFEYFVSAARFGSDGSDFTMFYPNIYCEPDSNYSYYNHNMPFWKWYNDVSAKVTAEDYVGDMYMANDYAPVVTLGAKFNGDYTYTNSKGQLVENANAIRFGGLYTEDMIRYRTDSEGVTYWDVTDLGIVLVPTASLGADDELTLNTTGAKKAAAVGIVNWTLDSNFADYESYAFYVTLAGIPDDTEEKKYSDLKYSARTYICYRDYVEDSETGKVHGTNAPDYYGNTVVRSINIINAHAVEDKLPETTE